MIPYLLGLAFMVGSLLVLALRAEPRTAMAGWALLSGVACVLAALAISRQPVGEATLLGRLGGAALRWGFRAGQGKLLWATLISWLVWLLIGATAIAALRVRADRQQLLMVLAWAADLAALFYVLGVWLQSHAPTGAGMGSNLVSLAGVLALMLVASAILWFALPGPAAKRLALLIAGGPPLLFGGGYALFLLVTLTVGRNARWN